MVFYTFRKVALAHKAAWQVIRFTAHKGYWLFGKKPAPDPVIQGEPKNDKPFTRRILPKLFPARPITMFDSVQLSNIPATAPAVAGYVNGHWPTYKQLHTSFPKAHRLSVAVTAAYDADCLDVEEGDATPDQAPAWVKRQHARGVTRPVVYTSVSQAARLMAGLAAAGIPRSAYRLWTAHYSFKEHRCTKACGFGMTGTADATQWTDKALARSLDQSICAGNFFDGPAV